MIQGLVVGLFLCVLITAYLRRTVRNHKAVETLQGLVAEALRDTNQLKFHFVIAPDASALTVKLPSELVIDMFRRALEAKLVASGRTPQVSIRLLEDNLDICLTAS